MCRSSLKLSDSRFSIIKKACCFRGTLFFTNESYKSYKSYKIYKSYKKIRCPKSIFGHLIYKEMIYFLRRDSSEVRILWNIPSTLPEPGIW